MPPVAPPLPELPLDAGAPPPATWSPSLDDAGPAGKGPAVALLPRGVGEVVDTAIGLYRRNWKLLVGTAAAVVVPVQVLSAFLNRNYFSQVSDMVRSLQRGITPSTGGTGVGVGSLGSLVSALALPFLTVALATAAASCYMGSPVTPGQAWRRTMRRSWAVLSLGLLRVLIIGI